MSKFTREERYFVLKLSDATKALTLNEMQMLRHLNNKVHQYRESVDKPKFECVVVEKDWPEYTPTWNAIANRVNGVTNDT